MRRALQTAALGALCVGCAAAPPDKERVDEPARCAATPRAALEDLGNGASLDRAPILRAFRRDKPRHTCCYQAHLSRHPEARGRATVTVTFEGARVTDADLRDADPGLELDGALSACLLETVRRMDVPEWARDEAPPSPASDTRPLPGESAPEVPSSGAPSLGVIKVSYPLKFSPTKATP